MTTAATPLLFDSMAKSQLLMPQKPVDLIRRAVAPVFHKLGSLSKDRTCLPSASKEQLFASTSQAFRAFDQGFRAISKPIPWMQGGDFAGLTTVSVTGIGAAQAYDSLKKSRKAEAIGDKEGAHLARLQMVEGASISAAATTMAPLRVLSFAKNIDSVAHTRLALTTGMTVAKSAFSWATTVLFLIYYALNGIRHGFGLGQWIQGRKWRKELLAAKDPIQVMKRQLQERIHNLNLTAKDYEKLALDEGAAWLKKVAQEAKKQGIELDFKDPRAAFEKYVEEHQELIENMVGPCPFEITTKGWLILLGKHLALQNECAKFEAECARRLGSKAIEALKTGDVNKVKMALTSQTEGRMLALKVALAVIGAASLIVGAVLSSGVAVGVVLALYGIGALISIYLEDWSALKAHLEKGIFSKRDRFFVYFTAFLSIAAVAGLITMSVLTGGATVYLAALILTTAWMVVNLRAVVIMKRHDLSPWEAQRPTLESMRKLLETKPDPEKIKQVFLKMSPEDQTYLQSLPEGADMLQILKKKKQEAQEILNQELQQLAQSLKAVTT